MSQWLAAYGIGGINWVLTTVLAILLSVFANLLTPWFQNYLARFSTTRREKRLQDLKAELEQFKKWTFPEIISLGFRAVLFFVLASSLAAIIQSLTSPLVVASRAFVVMFVVAQIVAALLYVGAFKTAYTAYRHFGKWGNLKYRDELEEVIARLERDQKG